jgi:hypothetical protein
MKIKFTAEDPLVLQFFYVLRVYLIMRYSELSKLGARFLLFLVATLYGFLFYA